MKTLSVSLQSVVSRSIAPLSAGVITVGAIHEPAPSVKSGIEATVTAAMTLFKD